MRIDPSGNIQIGKNDSNFATNGHILESGGRALHTVTNQVPMVLNRLNAGTQKVIDFYINSAVAGGINASAGGTPVFTSASDERLKTEVIDHESELENIMALRPVRWSWIDTELGRGEGFIAQELEQTAWADLVTSDDTGYKYVSGLGVVETRIIKAIQELTQRVQQLEAV
jgi:hypothetical protein